MPPGIVTGTVQALDTTDPFPGLQLLFTQDDFTVAKTTTDDQGHYQIALAPGEYVVKPRSDTKPFTESVSVRAGEETRFDLLVKPELPVVKLTLFGPPEQAAALEAAYDERLLPVLQKQGWIQTQEQRPPTPTGMASRYFSFGRPVKINDKLFELFGTRAFSDTLMSLGHMFGTPRADGYIDGDFSTHVPTALGERRRAGSGKTLAAGPGKSTGVRGRTVPAGAGRRRRRPGTRGRGPSVGRGGFH